MRDYGQFCPIARGSEILAERWTPIILRNLLQGCTTFNEIAAGAPGLSRSLLSRRLRELQRAGVIDIQAKPGGQGSLYLPTPAGRQLWPVLQAIAAWADEWMEVRPEHADPGLILRSWSQEFLRRDLLPDHRVVVRFDYQRLKRRETVWLLIEGGEVEACRFDPGFGDDLVVSVDDHLVFVHWHLGLTDWETAIRVGAVHVTGPTDLRRALPTWNRGPDVHRQRRAERAALARAPRVASPTP